MKNPTQLYFVLPYQIGQIAQINSLLIALPTVLASATDGCSSLLIELGDLGRWLILR